MFIDSIRRFWDCCEDSRFSSDCKNEENTFSLSPKIQINKGKEGLQSHSRKMGNRVLKLTADRRYEKADFRLFRKYWVSQIRKTILFSQFAHPRGILVQKIVKVGQTFICEISISKMSHVGILVSPGLHVEKSLLNIRFGQIYPNLMPTFVFFWKRNQEISSSGVKST